MASVLIIDDNRPKSAFLKISLMGKRHQVRRSQDIREAIDPIDGRDFDVVLINQATDDCTGWELFNHLKQLAPEVPTMVYVLETNCFYSADWICRAVEAVCEESEACLPPSVASFTRHRPPAMYPVEKDKRRFHKVR